MNLKKHLAVFLLLFLSVCLYAQEKEKKVSLSFNGIPLQEAMKRIEKESGYTFFYDAKQTDLNQKVSVNIKNQPVQVALATMFKNSNVEFELTNTQIVLMPKKKKQAPGKITNISGKIIDETGEGVIGANVVVDGTTNGVITDFDGNYTIQAPYGADLKISYVGYITQTVKAGQSIITKLIEDSKNLQEVVVVGYGVMKKQDLTGAVSSIKGADMEKEQHATIQDMLRTGVSGLAVGIEKDAKGNTSMMIRGKGTLGASSDPLLVLDGVIYNGQMTDINPNDIERIDVLKDASSTAVYGAQAANGVVLITTKKGTGSKPTISFSATAGLSFMNALPEVYEGDDFLKFRQDGIESTLKPKFPGYFNNPSGLTNTELAQWMDGDKGDPTDVWMTRLKFNRPEIDNYMAGRSIDWKDVIYQNPALRQDYTVSVAGKKDEMSYYSSLNYIKNESNVRGGGYDAIRARVNLENKVQSFLTYGLNTQFTTRNEGYIGASSGSYTALSPFGDMYESDGETIKLYPNENSNATHPLANSIYKTKKNNIYNLNAAIYFRVQLPFGFSLQTTYSPRFEWINDAEHISADHPASKDGGKSYRENSTEFSWQWDNLLKWNKEFGKNSFDFTGLANIEQHQFWSNKMGNTQFQPSDYLGWHGIGFGSVPTVYSGDTYRTGAAFMARMLYSYDQKYIVTATVRHDGYSAFGSSNPFATFPSVALAWVFSEEKFINMPSWFDYGKLRVSYGENGNRSIGPYAALMLLSPKKYFYIDQVNGQIVNVNTYFSGNMDNPLLKWESTVAWNAGLDFSLIGSRLGGSIDVYRKWTTDMLTNRKLPTVTGYSSVMSNVGEIQNTGIEVSLNSTNIKNNDFLWRTTFNFAYNKNKINKLYGLMKDVYDANGNVIGQKEADDPKNGYFIGHAIDEIWGYKFTGVWQENEIEEAKKYGQVPGDPKILDVDNNYKYNDDDKVFQGNETPKVRLNMRNEFTLFKNWNMSFSLYSYLGHKQSRGRFTNSDALMTVTNQIKRDYWTAENPINEYPRIGAKAPSGIAYSIYKNSSFLRFDNISVGYNFPSSMLKNAKIERLNINLTLKNAGVISNWPAYDPENSDANTPTTLYLGVNLTL